MSQPLSTGIVMDPISSIHIKKDSSFAMLLEAQLRGHDLWYMETSDLRVEDGIAMAGMHRISVKDDEQSWFRLADRTRQPLSNLDFLLMRKDPPFDIDYIYATYCLDAAERAGVTVVNSPGALRDCNEKYYITQFPQCCVPTLVSQGAEDIRRFVLRNGLCVVKPLSERGGESVFQARPDDLNLNVILETMTRNGTRQIMAQKYIPEIAQGDKRILLIDGTPIPYALARIPGPEDFRGNMVRGGRGEGIELSERDYWICEQLAPDLRQRGILFAGIDVIGDYLSEINVTSPTCIRELDREFGLNVAGSLFDVMEAKRNC